MIISKTRHRIRCFIVNKKTLFFYLLCLGFSVSSQTKELNRNLDSITILLKEYKKTKESHLPAKAFLLAEKTRIDSVMKKTYFDFKTLI